MLNGLLKKRKTIVELLRIVDSMIKVEKANTRVTCEHNCTHGKGCGAEHVISELEYIQTHWYEEPYGCTGGAMWHEGEGNFICPSCGHRNRLYNRPEIDVLKDLFKSKTDEH